MNTIINGVSGLFFNYWGMIIILFAFCIYWLLQRKKAEGIILSLMLRVEKEAEAILLQTGDAKFKWVVEKGWDLLPVGARLIIPKAVFIELAKILYEKAKDYIKSINTDSPNPAKINEE